MATTSIWSVKGWLGKVVIYVENPDKTTAPEIAKLPGYEKGEAAQSEEKIQSLSDVIAYAVNAEKTRRKGKKGEEGIVSETEQIMQQYVSGINCTPATARNEMIAVKKRYGKDEGIVAFHGYQSFAPGECTPALAHEIGVRLAQELWGGRFQVLVATHLDKAHHLHNHFVVNSVSYLDGKRYHRTNQDYQDMRSVSDRLCREYGLSVIEHPQPGKSRHYGEWRAEQEGRPTYHSIVREDVDEAILQARTEKQFFHYLKEKGYSIKFGKDITIRPEGRDRGLKLKRNFGEEYSLESIRRRILEEDPPAIPQGERLPEKKRYVAHVRGNLPKRKIEGLRGLYLHYCFLLGILPKNRPPVSPKQLHFLLREDLAKLEQISRETRLLCRCHIDTDVQLFSYKESLQEQMTQLSKERQKLRYQCRSIREEDRLSEVKAEIVRLTARIGELREEVVLCDGIAARSGLVRQKIQIVRQEKKQGKEEVSHEHIRRGR